MLIANSWLCLNGGFFPSQTSKKMELQERLHKLERSLLDETDLKLHELGLLWGATRRKAEDALKELG